MSGQSPENGGFLAALKDSLGGFLKLVFGQYTPPGWLSGLFSLLFAIPKLLFAGPMRLARAWPKATAGAAVVLVGGAIAVASYEPPPKPDVVTAEMRISGGTLGRSAAERFGLDADKKWVIAVSPAHPERPKSRDPLVVRFSESVAKLDAVNQDVPTGITLSPAKAGVWKFTADDRLTFTPTDDWTSGQTYTVELDKKILRDEVELKNDDARFIVEPFEVHGISTRFNQDPVTPSIKRVVATIRASAPMDRASLEKRLNVVRITPRPGAIPDVETPVKYTVRWDNHDRRAYVTTEPLAIPDNDEKLRVALEGGVGPADGGRADSQKQSERENIPGMTTFFKVNHAALTWVDGKDDRPKSVLVLGMKDGASTADVQSHLDVWLLPRHRPAQGKTKMRRNHRWSDPERVSPVDLRAGEKLEGLRVDPSADKTAKRHSVPLEVQPGRYLLVRVKKGLQSVGGYKLSETAQFVVRMPRLDPKLSIMHDGAILALSGDHTLTTTSRGLDRIKLKVGKVKRDDLNHLISQTSGDFGSPSFQSWSFDEDNITEPYSKTQSIVFEDMASPQYAGHNLTPYLGGQRAGLFFVKLKGYVPGKRHSSVSDRRFVLVTDLGVLMKREYGGARQVFVQSLATGDPVPDARVRLIAKNGRTLQSVSTDGGGRAMLPAFESRSGAHQPVAIVVEKGQDLSFLPYDRHDRRLSMSRFSVGGVRDGGGDKLRAFVFSDRGIYRPGETMRAGVLVRDGAFSRALDGVMVRTTITDARGKRVYDKRRRLDRSGFFDVSFDTEMASPTGRWRVDVRLLRKKRSALNIGSTSVMVESFVPDRLKITSKLSDARTKGWISPKDLKAHVTLHNLFGVPAAKHRVTARLNLSAVTPRFSAYDGYWFHAPLPRDADSRIRRELPDATTNKVGEVSFDLPLDDLPPGVFDMKVYMNGFEATGGRSVSTMAVGLVSPREVLLGMKADGGLRYISKGSKRTLNVIAVDKTLAKVAQSGLQVVVEKNEPVNVLTEEGGGVYAYRTVYRMRGVSKKALTLGKKGQTLTLDTSEPGDYVLTVRNAKDEVLQRAEYTVAGSANLAHSMERNAELGIKLKSGDVKAGDTLEMEIRAPYAGAGLITIERERVFAYKWFRSDTNVTTQRITVPEGLEPGAYVHVAFLRDASSHEIYTSPLSYAVEPFSVDKSKRQWRMSIKAPKRARPGDTVRAEVTTDRAGKAVVYAIDEGILQVANYKTPSPLSHFLKKRALDVDTYQLLDLLLPDHTLVQAVMKTGGDEMAMAKARGMAGANLNPFQRKVEAPMAFWSGVVNMKRGKNTVKIPVPEHFAGSLRIMAVAASSGAVGSAETSTTVRGDMILSPSGPFFTAPGDTFDIGLSVANQTEGSGAGAKFKVTVKPSAHVALAGEASQVVTIPEGQDARLTFAGRATDTLGGAEIAFSVVRVDGGPGTKSKGKGKLTMSVRPATPRITTVHTGHVTNGTAKVQMKHHFYSDLREGEVALGTIPVAVARGLYRYVDTFPHGCTEQVLSKSMAGMMLSDVDGIGVSKTAAKQSLARALRTLQDRQNGEGAYGMWTRGPASRLHHTVYALHFLAEAEDRRLVGNDPTVSAAVSYVKSKVSSEPQTLDAARNQAYALYVLARHGEVMPRETKALAALLPQAWPEAKQDLANVYLAATHLLSKDKKAADALIAPVTLATGGIADSWYFSDQLARDGQVLYVLAKHFPARLPAVVKGDALAAMLKPLAQNRYNTLSSAYMIMGLRAYVDAIGGISDAKVPTGALASLMGVIGSPADLAAGGKPAVGVTATTPQGDSALALPKGLFPSMAFGRDVTALAVKNGLKSPLFYQAVESGFEDKVPTAAIKDGLEVSRQLLGADGKPLASVEVGDEVTVRVVVRSTTPKTVHDVAIVDLMPAGFDIVRNEAARQGMPVEGFTRLSPDAVDFREDRAVIFTSATPKARAFAYKARVTAAGRFVVPPPFATSMYDLSKRGRGTAGTIVAKPMTVPGQ